MHWRHHDETRIAKSWGKASFTYVQTDDDVNVRSNRLCYAVEPVNSLTTD
jgi:hypothetical protein